MRDPFGDRRDPLVKTMERSAVAASIYAERQKIARLRGTLIAATEKLRLYRAQHSGEYVGGVEFHELMKMIDTVMRETE